MLTCRAIRLTPFPSIKVDKLHAIANASHQSRSITTNEPTHHEASRLRHHGWLHQVFQRQLHLRRGQLHLRAFVLVHSRPSFQQLTPHTEVKWW